MSIEVLCEYKDDFVTADIHEVDGFTLKWKDTKKRYIDWEIDDAVSDFMTCIGEGQMSDTYNITVAINIINRLLYFIDSNIELIMHEHEGHFVHFKGRDIVLKCKPAEDWQDYVVRCLTEAIKINKENGK